MALAFLTGAVASGLTAAALTALVVWIVTVIAGSSDPWSIAPTLVTVVAAIFAVLTYFAEGVAYRASMDRRRATGEPWAYRE